MRINNNMSNINFGIKGWDIKSSSPNADYYYKGSQKPNCFIGCEFKEPVNIKKGLEQIWNDTSLNHRIKNAREVVETINKYKDFKLYGITGIGSTTTTFDIGDEKVLKVSLENPYQFREYEPKFDIPLIDKVEKIGNKLFAYIQAKADMDKTVEKDVIEVINRIKEAGYEPTLDLHPSKLEQVGWYNGKPWLVDVRCAVTKNFSRFFKHI